MKENRYIHYIHQMPARYRLFISLFFAGIAFAATGGSTVYSLRLMVAWIAFAIPYLVLFWITIVTAHPDEIRLIAKKQDTSRSLAFIFVIAASFISLFAIILLMQVLPDKKEADYYYHIALSVVSVICSWILIHSIFTFRYAHLFYSGKKGEEGTKKEYAGGLLFPNDETPDYLDFAYFAFVVGMTFQVSDVQVTSSIIRRLALLHGVLSFAYNTIIVALSINIISGLIQK